MTKKNQVGAVFIVNRLLPFVWKRTNPCVAIIGRPYGRLRSFIPFFRELWLLLSLSPRRMATQWRNAMRRAAQKKSFFTCFLFFFFFSILSSDNQSMRRYYKTVAAVAAANKMKPSRPVAFLTCFFSLTIIVASFEFGLLCNITTTTTTRNDVHRASEERRNRGTFTDDKKMISGDYLSL